MANVANGYLSIKLKHSNESNKTLADEIIANLEKNANIFFYGGKDSFELIFSEKDNCVDISFTGRNSGQSCWEWFEKQMSKENKSKDLSVESQKLLVDSEIMGGSSACNIGYRDRVFKSKGSFTLERHYHTKLNLSWPEIFELLSAYDFKVGETNNIGNCVEISLIEKNDEDKYLFKVIGQIGGFIILINKILPEVDFFFDIEELDYDYSINKIFEDMENGDLEQEEGPQDWWGNGELVDDLLGDLDTMFEKELQG
tara:strand:- start:304 stop:1071 length:768 start_codon:yes stop_codon:yes gene_type:complete